MADHRTADHSENQQVQPQGPDQNQPKTPAHAGPCLALFRHPIPLIHQKRIALIHIRQYRFLSQRQQVAAQFATDQPSGPGDTDPHTH